VQEIQQADWLPASAIGVGFPHWVGTWFATFANVQGLIAQGVAALLVLGSYLIASELKVRRPRRRGLPVATHRLPAERDAHPASLPLAAPTRG